MLGISTSVELFEGRLPRSCVALLRGKHFEVQEAGNCVDRIYETLQTDPDTNLWLGRNVTSTLFENTSDYFQSPEAFSRMVKVRTTPSGVRNRILIYTVYIHVSFLRKSSVSTISQPRFYGSRPKQALWGRQKPAIIPNVRFSGSQVISQLT